MCSRMQDNISSQLENLAKSFDKAFLIAALVHGLRSLRE